MVSITAIQQTPVCCDERFPADIYDQFKESRFLLAFIRISTAGIAKQLKKGHKILLQVAGDGLRIFNRVLLP